MPLGNTSRAALAPLAILALLGTTDCAHADLAEFDADPHGSYLNPISFAELVAWSDACLNVSHDSWPAIEKLHTDYLTASVSLTQHDRAVDRAFFDQLVAALGADRVTCIGAFAASRAAIEAIAPFEHPASQVGRGLLAIAAAKSPSALDAQQLALDLGTALAVALAPAGQGTLEIDGIALAQRPFLAHRSRLDSVIGASRADEFQLSVLRGFDNCEAPLLNEHARAIIRKESKLSTDERAAVRAAYARADAALREILLTGRGMPSPGSAVVTEEEGTRRFEGPTWCGAKSKIADALAKDLEQAIGPERTKLLFALVLGYASSTFSTDDEGVRQSDLALEAFVDRAHFDSLVGEFGSRFWQPVRTLGEWEGSPVGVPHPIERTLLTAIITGPLTAEESSMVDLLHADHLARWNAAFGELVHLERRRSISNQADDSLRLMDEEDSRVLDELRAALGPQRLSPESTSLFRLARAEASLSPRRGVSSNGSTNFLPRTARSAALVALGLRQANAPELGGVTTSHFELVRAALAPLANDWTAQIRAQWTTVRDARTQLPSSPIIKMTPGMDRTEVQRQTNAWRRLLTKGDLALLIPTFQRHAALLESLEALETDEGSAAARDLFVALYWQYFNYLQASMRLSEHLASVKDVGMRTRVLDCLSPKDGVPSATVRGYLSAAAALERVYDSDEPTSAELQRKELSTNALAMQVRALDARLNSNTARAWKMLRDAGDSVAQTMFAP